MLSALLKSSGQAKPRTSSVVANETLEGNALFEALICELHWMALQIGAITCCMNASLASRRSWMLRACSNLVPIESSIIKTSLKASDDIGLPRDLSAAIRRIYLDLADAKKAALPLINNAGVLVAPRIPIEKLEQITAIWRKLSEDCRNAVFDTEPETRWRLADTYTGNSLVLSKFLKEAASGSRTCVNHYGEVALPLLPQRRRLSRIHFHQPCKISWRGITSIVATRTLSKNGLALSCEFDLKIKETISIELRSGRKFKGTVVCCKAGNVDVRFETPLADNDILLTA
jgi:hypothetical protein